MFKLYEPRRHCLWPPAQKAAHDRLVEAVLATLDFLSAVATFPPTLSTNSAHQPRCIHWSGKAPCPYLSTEIAGPRYRRSDEV